MRACRGGRGILQGFPECGASCAHTCALLEGSSPNTWARSSSAAEAARACRGVQQHPSSPPARGQEQPSRAVTTRKVSRHEPMSLGGSPAPGEKPCWSHTGLQTDVRAVPMGQVLVDESHPNPLQTGSDTARSTTSHSQALESEGGKSSLDFDVLSLLEQFHSGFCRWIATQGFPPRSWETGSLITLCRRKRTKGSNFLPKDSLDRTGNTLPSLSKCFHLLHIIQMLSVENAAHRKFPLGKILI